MSNLATDDLWEIRWDHDSWSVELTRFPESGGFVTVHLQADSDSYVAFIRTSNSDAPIPWPWDWATTPAKPADICSMCERLAVNAMSLFS